ncbi:MAG: MATE family efflux transporter [Lentisphaeria bacterium]|nr:MATE family efflux transporter [Lentisphaeria bacterium]
MKKNNIDLTEGPISKILLSLSIPIIITNLMHVVYNLTDTFWVGKLTGSLAIDGVAVTNNVFPLVWFFASLASGLGTASTVLVSRAVGSKNSEGTKQIIGQISLLLWLSSFVFIFLGLFGAETLIDWLGTPDEIKANAVSYTRIIMLSVMFMFWFGLFQSISHAQGNSVVPMKIQLASVLINVVLDPILIFGWFGFTAYGVTGAAYATFVSRLVSSLLAAYFFKRYYRDSIPSWSDLKPKLKVLKQVFRIGLPSSISQSTTSFGFLILQNFINNYGTVVCAAYAFNNKLVGIFLIPAMGINNAMVSVAGQNIGAGKTDRAIESVWVSFKLVFWIMGFGAILLFFIGGDLTRLFINQEEIVTMTSKMFRIVSISAFICALMIVFTSALDAAGRTELTTVVSLVRLWCIRIPFAYLFSGYFIYFYGVKSGYLFEFLNFFSLFPKEDSYNGLWWAMFASNFIGLIWAYLLFRRIKWQALK